MDSSFFLTTVDINETTSSSSEEANSFLDTHQSNPSRDRKPFGKKGVADNPCQSQRIKRRELAENKPTVAEISGGSDDSNSDDYDGGEQRLLSLQASLSFIQNKSSSSSSSLSPPPVSSSSLCSICTHHVFPSFRGEDVRRGFLSHIQMEFQRNGITSFVDNDIKRGESIGPELIRAIRGSRCAIILISRNYASSSWCLDELAEIMKCREELGQTVMTVFYKVDPSHVKKLTGEFGEIFRKTCAGKTKEVIGRWRQALAKVATIAGYHSSSWDNEAAMIKKIATDISNKLNNSVSSSDFDGLIGMKAHLKKMERLLCLDSDEVRMIGIWGPSGIGKTTIARVAYNKLSNSNSFQLSVFMENIKGKYTRPCSDSDNYGVMLQLQQQLMSQITNQKDIEIPNLGILHDRLKDKKVLVVLDGVDKLVQLDAMAKETWWFGPGSRIIITTQYQNLFRQHRINHIYKVDFPSTNEALQIFCMNAFGQSSPQDGFEELAQEVVRLAGKLPLGLRVLGSYFRRMSRQEWANEIPKLRTSINTEIGSILQFSYDALDEEYKYLFLHLACCFNYEYTGKVENHLANKFLDVRQRFNILAEKSLISMDDGYIKIHNLLIQLAKDIVRKQSIQPGQRQFLVDKRDICELLTDGAAGSRSVIGIHFDLDEDELNISERAFEGMHDLQFIRFYGGENNKFHLSRGLDYLSRKLRLLYWTHFPMTFLPSVVNPEFLVEVDLSYSKLEKLWEGIKSLQNLKWMNLSFSVNLKELPDLSTATNLQRLDLSDCSSLMKLPSTIGYNNNLQILKLGNCSSLITLPSFIGNATNLEELDLNGCSSLVELPSSMGNATNLEELDLGGCSSLVELPSSMGNATNLEKLDLRGCSSLVELPSSIGNATNLKNLNLSGCSSLVELPSSIGNATNLKNLYLMGCSSLVELPASMGNATNLKNLDLSGCSSLVELPSSIGNATNLENLNLSGCSSLVELPFSIGNATNLKMLNLGGFSSLVELPSSMGNATNLESLNLSGCSSLVKLPSTMRNATNLKILDLGGCSSLVELPASMGNATNLKNLNLSGCSSLVELPSSMGNATNLEKLDLRGCSSLVELPSSMGNATNLKNLYLMGCSSLVELLASMGNATNLKNLDLCGCSSLVELPSSMGNATNLENINLSECSSLVELPSSMGNATNLENLNLRGCSSLVELPSTMGNITNLENLCLRGCSSLVELPSSMGNATNLKNLYLNGCSSLVKLPSTMRNATNLKILDLGGCSSLVELPSSMGNATNLKELDLSGCSSLVELPSSMGNATNLKNLDLSGCSNLVELPSSMGNATNLENLNLSECSSMVELPSFIGNATNLEKLYLGGCSSLVELPSSMGNASNLKWLELSSLSCVVELPSWIGNATNLEYLDLSHCLSLVELPAFVGNLQKLHCLKLKGCSKLEVLPININLESLYTLDLTDCSHLKSFPEISTNITDLGLGGTAIKEVPLSIRSWSHLDELHMSYTENLKEFPHAFNSITALYLNDTEIQEIPPWFKRISRLRLLVLKGCRKLAVLPQILDSLSGINAEDCESLERLDCSFHNPNIFLNFAKCFKLNQEARDLIIQTPTSNYAIVPGGKVPAYFTHRATNGGSLTIKLNERHLPTLMRFKACILLVNKGEGEAGDDMYPRARTDYLLVTCKKSRHFLEPVLTEHLYIFEVEAEVTSSELIFEFKLSRDYWHNDWKNDWKIGECGVRQLMEVPSC